MIRIFAKQGTDEKVLFVCKSYQVNDTQHFLNQKYGGNWVWIEELKMNEMFLCKDGAIYEGFDNRDGRYANIESLIH